LWFDTPGGGHLESLHGFLHSSMLTNVDDIGRELAALTQRFIDLGARLGQAARALEEAGAPPEGGLVEALADARGQFVELRAQALGAADAAGVPATAEPESLHDLEPLLAAIGEALAARARREALQRLQAAALDILDRVLEIAHRDDRHFPALVAGQARARQAREAVAQLTEPDSEDARRAIAAVEPFADLLAMIENRDGVDDERYAQLEESVSSHFGRALAVAGARGRLAFAADIGQPPEPEADAAPVVAPAAAPDASGPDAIAEPAGAPTDGAPEPALAEAREPDLSEPGPPPIGPLEDDADEALPATAAAEAADGSGADETAQWWLAAWARWSGWRANQPFEDAVREELGKYPYLLSVPIQRSPEYEDGLLAYGYSILMDHVDKQKPGCVGNALNSLGSGTSRPVGDQLYDYLVAQGRLRETYADFLRRVLSAALPEPGMWFQFRILESSEDTRILQRPSARLGDGELSGHRLAGDGQRYAEHTFKMTLAPLTARFVLLSVDVKEPRSAGFRLVSGGAPSDAAWIVSVPVAGRKDRRQEPQRIAEEGTHVTGLGKEHAAAWVAVFNADPASDRRCELSVFLRKDGHSPFRSKG
jgi:hypothetical protein